MALPRIVFVKEEWDSDGTTYLLAGRNLEEVAPGEVNDPETVGTYVLKETRRFVKQVRVIEKRRG